jgi:hypothetical protein
MIEIISWNDYGESHYVGPLHGEQMDSVFGPSAGKAFNYANNMPHDGWLATLPFFIDLYKSGKATVGNEALSAWYRPYPVSSKACGNNATVGNTHFQFQQEFPPETVVQDKVFFNVLAVSQPTVQVTVGGAALPITWKPAPYGGVGVYHGSAAFGSGSRGAVVITATTSKSNMVVSGGPAIGVTCNNAIWNAWTGKATGAASTLQNSMSIYSMGCISGTAPGNFAGLCSNACRLTYCPKTACQCLQIGPPPTIPAPTASAGYPIAGEDATYSGLCSFNCAQGYCPSGACGHTSYPLSTPTVSPFDPPACTAGTSNPGKDSFVGLCNFA